MRTNVLTSEIAVGILLAECKRLHRAQKLVQTIQRSLLLVSRREVGYGSQDRVTCLSDPIVDTYCPHNVCSWRGLLQEQMSTAGKLLIVQLVVLRLHRTQRYWS